MKHSLEIVSELELSPAECFELWRNPEELAQWWGPLDDAGRSFQATIVEWKLQEGAAWRIDMQAPDGSVFRQGGEIIEVKAPQRLRFSFHWIENGQSGPRTEITVEFQAQGPGTRMRFKHAEFASTQLRDGHKEGWQQCLDRLVARAQRLRNTSAVRTR